MACACSGGKTNLIYACSGAANTGFLADQVARQLMKENIGSMTCLAGIGANLSGFIASAEGADRNIVIDGCPVACGKKQFEARGIPFDHFVMTNYGVEKNKTAITGDIIVDISNKVASAITEKVCSLN
ncbi:putative zinc-binding protein [Gracilinema caldarium]|uniref:putative zinc-binding protein n=1 Tax=Gracilinema caldarium TaxID=215591 RepID=UPI0026F065CF|nr:putative zinc-binding protein [Gracilinema caldarium]